MTIIWRMVRDWRRSITGWSLGVLAMVGFVTAMYPSVRDQADVEKIMANMPEAFRSMIGYDAAIPMTSPAGYLQGRLFSLIVPVMLLVFAIGIGARAIGGLEESGRLEPLLANPVTRTRIAVQRYLASLLLLTVLVGVFAAAISGLAPLFDALDGVSVPGLLGACAAAGGLALLHLSLAFALGAGTGRRGPAVALATVVAFAGYLVHSLLSVVEALAPLRYLTPWYWYLQRNMLVNGVPPAAIITPLVLSALLFCTGWLLFRRRDLR
jgi:ABC-2 type transport system permease protein